MARRMEVQSEVAGLPPGSLEDKDLTLAFQSGDKGAYQAIYDRYSSRVHSVCRRMLGNPQDAQEAAQESFLRVYQALGRFNGRYQLGAWITRIATNVCLDQLRARARRPIDAAELDAVDLEDDRHHDLTGPEFLVIRNAESHRVRKILGQLPPMHRAAIVLRDFEGLSYAEVAVALGMTEGQVKALIHRARQNFKRSWTPLSLLMPWRLAGRFKEVDATTKEHFSQAVASSAQIAPTCTTTFQQCGQYVAERVAPVFTAVVVGAVGGGMAVARSSRPAQPVKVQTESSRISTVELAEPEAKTGAPKAHVERPQTNAAAPDPEKAEEPAQPAQPSPQPAATPVPEPSSSPSTTPSPAASPTAPPKPEKPVREPFMAALGFDRAGPPQPAAPSSNKTVVDCDPVWFEQRLEIAFSDGEQSYPAAFSLRGGSSGAELQLSIWKSGREIYYTGAGTLEGGSRDGDQLSLEYRGTYQTGNKEAEDSLGLPGSGSFAIYLTLDCTYSELLTESAFFSS